MHDARHAQSVLHVLSFRKMRSHKGGEGESNSSSVCKISVVDFQSKMNNSVLTHPLPRPIQWPILYTCKVEAASSASKAFLGAKIRFLFVQTWS